MTEFGRAVRTYTGVHPTLSEIREVIDSYEQDKAKSFPTWPGSPNMVTTRYAVGGELGWYAEVPDTHVRAEPPLRNRKNIWHTRIGQYPNCANGQCCLFEWNHAMDRWECPGGHWVSERELADLNGLTYYIPMTP